MLKFVMPTGTSVINFAACAAHFELLQCWVLLMGLIRVEGSSFDLTLHGFHLDTVVNLSSELNVVLCELVVLLVQLILCSSVCELPFE